MTNSHDIPTVSTAGHGRVRGAAQITAACNAFLRRRGLATPSLRDQVNAGIRPRGKRKGPAAE